MCGLWGASYECFGTCCEDITFSVCCIISMPAKNCSYLLSVAEEGWRRSSQSSAPLIWEVQAMLLPPACQIYVCCVMSRGKGMAKAWGTDAVTLESRVLLVYFAEKVSPSLAEPPLKLDSNTTMLVLIFLVICLVEINVWFVYKMKSCSNGKDI